MSMKVTYKVNGNCVETEKSLLSVQWGLHFSLTMIIANQHLVSRRHTINTVLYTKIQWFQVRFHQCLLHVDNCESHIMIKNIILTCYIYLEYELSEVRILDVWQNNTLLFP